MRATSSGERGFRGLALGLGTGFAASTAFSAACSRWMRSSSVLSMRFSARESRAISSDDAGSSRLARLPHGVDRHRPQVLDEHQRQLALRAVAELLHPRLDHAVGLLPLLDQRARVLGIAADGRARAVLALGPDACGDLVDGGAVCDGRIDGLADIGRQLGDGGAPERGVGGGRLGLGGFVLHGGALLAGCVLTHPAMLPHAVRPVHRTMFRGVCPPVPAQHSVMPGFIPGIHVLCLYSTKTRGWPERVRP